MAKKDFISTLKRVVKDKQLENLEQYLVFDVNGGYELYGEYFIEPVGNGYNVSKKGTATTEQFTVLRHAVAWASLDKRGSYTDANRMILLDQLLEGASVDLQIHQNMYRKASDVEKKLIYSAKIQEDKLKKTQVTAELNTYITNAKNWQYRQFKEAAK
jgi:hypothetical protein